MKKFLNTVLSCATLAASLVACDNSPAVKTFTGTELLGTVYAITPPTDATYTLSYNAGAPDAISATFVELGADASGFRKFKFGFNSSTKVFTIRITDLADVDTAVLNLPDYKVTATLKNGTEVAFSDILTDIVSVHAKIDLTPLNIATFGNCEVRQTTDITLDVTSDTAELLAHSTKAWTDIQSNTLPLTDCRAYLNQQKIDVAADAPTADNELDTLNDLGRLNINRVPQLVSLELSYLIEGEAPAAGMALSPLVDADASTESAYDLDVINGEDGVTVSVPNSSSMLLF